MGQWLAGTQVELCLWKVLELCCPVRQPLVTFLTLSSHVWPRLPGRTHRGSSEAPRAGRDDVEGGGPAEDPRAAGVQGGGHLHVWGQGTGDGWGLV